MARRWLTAGVLTIAGCGDPTPAAPDARRADAAELACSAAVGWDDLAFEVVVSGLVEPVWAGAPAGDPRVFVVERRGRIRIVRDGGLLDEPFLTVPVATDTATQGLLGAAFPPDFATDPRVYVYFTDPETADSVIAEHRVSADPDRAEPEGRRLLTIPKDTGYHSAGSIAFGPDDRLYAATGDDANPALAQDPGSLLGKLLRIDPAGGTVETWAVGLRNPWRFSFDPETGDLYVGDVGERLREEIDVVPAGTGAGANFGWPIKEASLCFNAADPNDEGFGPCSVPGLEIQPAIELGRGAVIGGHVYRGTCMPALAGAYFYSDNSHGFLHSFRWNDGVVGDTRDLGGAITGDPPAFVTSLGVDGAGELLVVTYYLDSGPDGGVVSRLVPR